MKVLQINSVSGIGSTGRIVSDIDKILKKQGHESYIAYGRETLEKKENEIKIGTSYDTYSHVIKTRILDMHGFGSRKATYNFIEEIDKIKPDIIHLHNIHGYYINIEILFKYIKEKDIPVVWTLHDCWTFTGHCAYFEYAECECWRVDKNEKCIQKNEYPASWLLNNSRDNFKRKKKAFTGVKNLTIVTPSKWLANLVKQSFLKEYSVKVINNGIDLDIFKPIEGNFREKYNLKSKFIILGVANLWDERKGLKYFVEMSESLKKDEVIVLVGVSKAQKEKLPKNIIGITRTNSIVELAELYSAADVFVNPTLEDNFPTTNLEALACGTPVITFDTGGSPEAINQKTGIVVEKENTEKLYNAISRLNNIIPSEECVQRAIKLFNSTNQYYKYVNLYEKINLTNKN